MKRRRQLALWLFALVFCSQAYFSGDLGWSQAARLAGALAFVEPGPEQLTFRIDRFIESDKSKHPRELVTGDWSEYGGHYYVGKAPGTTLLAVPAYALLYGVERAAGLLPEERGLTRTNAYLVNLWVTVLWAALAAVALFELLSGFLPTEADALTATLVSNFATLLFPFSSSLWGHVTAASFLVLSLWALFGKKERPLLAGVLGGVAVLVEYPAILLFAFLTIAAFFRARGRKAAMRSTARVALGFLPAALAWAAYNRASFGSVFSTAYAHVNPLFLDKGINMGSFTWPDLGVLAQLLVLPYRGIFLFMPVLLAAIPGAVHYLRDRKTRALARLALACALATLATNVCWRGWWGGWCTGARLLIIGLPFWCILLYPISRIRTRAWRWAYGAAIAISALNMLLINAVECMVPESERSPLFGVIHGHALAGDYPLSSDAFNLGQRVLGLHPPLDLLLFLLLVGGAVWRLRRLV